jgi:hypothetical protein
VRKIASTAAAGAAALAVAFVAAPAHAYVSPPVDIRSGSCPSNMVTNQVSGTCVVALQDLLINWGFGADLGSSGADGGFGSHTVAAVEAFQTAAGIGVDGQVGTQTKAALYSLANPEVGRGTIHVQSAQGLCLDADAATPGQNGQRVQGYTCNGWQNQHWIQYHVPDSTSMMLVNAGDGLCLDADANTAGQQGQRVQDWACNGNRTQEWNPLAENGGSILINALDGEYLTLPTVASGTGIVDQSNLGLPGAHWVPGS